MRNIEEDNCVGNVNKVVVEAVAATAGAVGG